MKHLAIAALLSLAAAPVWADGDVDTGAKLFKKCKACHSVVSDTGEVLQKGGRTGPNLFGVAGRTIGTMEGFRYGTGLAALGEQGVIWDAARFASFTSDPRGFVKVATGNPKAKTKMALRLKSGAEDVYAYLESLAPPAAEAPATDDSIAETADVPSN